MRLRCTFALVLAVTLLLPPAHAAKDGRGANAFQFGVIGHSFKNGPDEAGLKQAISETNQANLAFVVVTGIKASTESCSDKLYGQRKNLLEGSYQPMVVSLAASDWSDCKNKLGKTAAIERLNRLREVFFADALSLGQRKIPQTRLSSSASFRSYAENAHWVVGRVLFATINLPADNNHFRPEAGRNSEFEDRLIANRAWLKRLFEMAQRRKFDGLVLFSDGDAGLQTDEKRLPATGTKRDGFAETRRQIRTLSQKFPGRLLLIDTQNESHPAEHGIVWSDNVGHLSVTSNWVEIRVNPDAARLTRVPLRRTPLFTVKGAAGATAAQ